MAAGERLAGGANMIGAAFDRARLRRARPIETGGLGSGRVVALEGSGVHLRAWRGGPRRASATVVVVPDPPNVIDHHVAQLEGIARDAGVLALELPGFGHSGVPEGFDFAIGSYAETLVRALNAHSEGPLVLVFTCLSGLIALEMAAQSDRVVGLLLVQTPDLADARSWAVRVDPGGLMAKPLLGQMIVRAGRRHFAKTWYDAALPRGTDSGPGSLRRWRPTTPGPITVSPRRFSRLGQHTPSGRSTSPPPPYGARRTAPTGPPTPSDSVEQ